MVNIAIIGASGAVGQELLKILQERNFPCDSLRLFGSSRSAGTSYTFNGQSYKVEELTPEVSFECIDIAFASAGASTSRRFAEQITKYGTILIDNSSAFRMDDDVPLVVPEINPEDALSALSTGSRHIIANPNCTTIILAVVLQAIERLAHIRRVHVATYQSASGAGAQAMLELEEQYRQLVNGEQPTVNKFAYQLAYNLIPHIDVFADGDYTKEELKMFNETRKIMHSDIRVSATCVRVPTLRAHSEAVWAELEKPVHLTAIREAIAHAPGCELVDDLSRCGNKPRPLDGDAADCCHTGEKLPYPMPLYFSGKDNVAVGRIRKDLADDNALTFFCVGDQIRKGAALNAIQIAEYLLDRMHK
ncbi:MAG: aspartate-semialdehyde dehydrogenase [Paludibacteraceae bacterium]|nr:aspartate-semialdehyde dehydrogenase [Paludibacteraceae bacterium]